MSDQTDKLKIAVLLGGIGSERDISLQSGATIAAALRKAGVDVVEFDIAPDRLSILDDETIDVFFPALHGQFGEDGQLQAILEQRNLCYTGSDSAASITAFDKVKCKSAVAAAGVPIPLHITVSNEDTVTSIAHRIAALGYKFVTKPISQGSSVGVNILSDIFKASETAIATFNEYGSCMVEQYIAGKEITVGILDSEPLPIIEIRPKTGFYDFQAKYLDDTTEYLFDTIDDSDLVKNLSNLGVKSFNASNCRHWGRVDFLLTEDKKPYFLEINTLPGFTSHSLVPMAGKKAGYSASDVCMKIVNAALKDNNVKV
ncbi:MAG: D-alanine--D-alanine ligase [Anaerohalosphaera sp.]|nr:D-alanine--D-alanine ligase [Anaerohalosphaera sp.]